MNINLWFEAGTIENFSSTDQSVTKCFILLQSTLLNECENFFFLSFYSHAAAEVLALLCHLKPCKQVIQGIWGAGVRKVSELDLMLETVGFCVHSAMS